MGLMRTRGMRLAGILMMAVLLASAARAGDGDPLFPTGAAHAPAANDTGAVPLFVPRQVAAPEPPPRAAKEPPAPPAGTVPAPAELSPGGEPLFVPHTAAAPTLPPVLFRAQADATGYAPPDVELPLPNGSFWPNGLFVYAEYAMYRQNVPLRNQLVAIRGFVDTDGALTQNPGMFVGSRAIALQTNQVRGPGTWSPGMKLGIGYRFDDGTTIDFSWLYLLNVKYTAVAGIGLPQSLIDPALSNTFLFSPVFNFPIAFSGPPDRLTANGAPVIGGPYGIWNGATAMSEEYDQRAQFYDLNIRKPIFETENWRTYAIGGPRFAWLWERYKWFTQAIDAFSDESSVWAANYTNIISNRMYGARVGMGNECYIGHGLSASLDLSGSAFLDVVKERTAYSRDDKHIGQERKRSRTDYTFVPSAEATFNLCWYPYRGVQFKIGYDVQAFFNVVSSEHPIDFDYSAVSPTFNRVFRIFDGLQLGGSISF